MAILLIAYAKADIRASKSALEAVRAGEGNEKATKGVAAYHAQQAIEKIIKAEIYKVNPGISPRKMYTHKIYDLCAIAENDGIKVPKGSVKKVCVFALPPYSRGRVWAEPTSPYKYWIFGCFQ